MAMDILLPYEHSLNRPLQFTDILNVRTVREMLCNFKESTNLTSTTKLKYLSVFELFVEYLLKDCDSPEVGANASVEETLLRNIKMGKVFA